MPKLLLISAIVELLGFGAMEVIEFDYNFIFLSAGVIYFLVIYSKYRNKGARHTYEKETKNKMSNIKTVDDYTNHRTGLSKSTISGANNRHVSGQSATSKLFDSLTKEGIKSNVSSSFNNTVASKIKKKKKKDDK